MHFEGKPPNLMTVNASHYSVTNVNYYTIGFNMENLITEQNIQQNIWWKDCHGFLATCEKVSA